jgi:hypothetical protein
MLENLNEEERGKVDRYIRLHKEFDEIKTIMDTLNKRSKELLEELERLRKSEKKEK